MEEKQATGLMARLRSCPDKLYQSGISAEGEAKYLLAHLRGTRAVGSLFCAY